MASQQLLTTFVAAHGRKLSLAARRSVDSPDWLQHKEPRGPRPVCQLLLERLAEAEAEAGQLLEDTGSMMQRPSSFPDTLRYPALPAPLPPPPPPPPPPLHSSSLHSTLCASCCWNAWRKLRRKRGSCLRTLDSCCSGPLHFLTPSGILPYLLPPPPPPPPNAAAGTPGGS